MTVQIVNARLGVRRVEPDGFDSHGSPVPAAPGDLEELLPGKVTELDSGQWQLALDPACWPVRIGDYVEDAGGRQWVAMSVKFLQTPALAPEEAALDLDLDVSFVRVMGNEVTDVGTEPADPALTGRTGAPG